MLRGSSGGGLSWNGQHGGDTRPRVSYTEGRAVDINQAGTRHDHAIDAAGSVGNGTVCVLFEWLYRRPRTSLCLSIQMPATHARNDARNVTVTTVRTFSKTFLTFLLFFTTFFIFKHVGKMTYTYHKTN